MTEASTDLSALARRCGLQEHWIDAHGRARRVQAEPLRTLVQALGLAGDTAGDVAASHAALDEDDRSADPLRVGRVGQSLPLPGWKLGSADLVCEDSGATYPVNLQPHTSGAQLPLPDMPGYYALRQAGHAEQRLAITPRAPDMATLLGRPDPRRWGAMAQVYSLRRQDNDPVRRTWGHGDLATVASVAQRLGRAGADVLALNPLHAMFSALPAACSPYSPSNRMFLNPLYAAPAMVFGESPVRLALTSLGPVDWAALDEAAIIDWPRAAQIRMRVLRWLHERCGQMSATLQRSYRTYCQLHGQALQDHAIFETLHGTQRDPSQSWTTWDRACRDARSAAVGEFAAHHASEVDFHCFAQWAASASLARAQTIARDAGMGVGLLSDLAVGVSPAGSQVWGDPDSFLQRVSVGAPPDIHQPLGQSWGLAALSPRTLRKRGYAPFISVLRAALAQTGGTRIDHMLGMERLWIVPDGESPTEGAYLQLPGQAMLGLIALEAWRHRSLVIGENLGTVPPGFDDRLRDHGIAGMNVLWFMRAPSPAPDSFLATAQWPADGVAMTTTHDLPTLSGWWRGTDIVQRDQAGRLGNEHAASMLLQERESDKLDLWRLIGDPAPFPDVAPARAMLAFVASAPCALALAAMEDIAGVDEAPNVPGTTVEFPNWRRRLPGDTIVSLDSPSWRDRLSALSRGREDA